MSNWKHLVRAHLAALRLPPERETEIIEEIALHLEAAYDDAQADGLSPEDALTHAIQSYDWRLLECELARAEQSLFPRAWTPLPERRRGGMRMETLWQDLRFAVRMLWRQRNFAVMAVLTLALGIGLNTAIFSVVNAVLLRPLPYPEPGQLVQVWETWPQRDAYTDGASPNNFLDWRQQAQSFAQLSAQWGWLYTLGDTNETTEISGTKVTANYFALLGVRPQLGRAFAPDEDQPGKAPVVVISHEFWQRRLGGRSDVIGQTIKLDADVRTIIGVLGAEFRRAETRPDYRSDVWTPFVLEAGARLRGNHYLHVLGRLKPGVTLTQAQAEMNTIAARLAQDYPDTNRERGINLVPLHEQLTGSIRRALWILQAATALVLLIACTNVANLLLARVAAREKELAIRTALGAGRWQLVRLLLTEGVVLAGLGGAAGFFLAGWGVRALLAAAPRDLPRVDEIGLDARVLAFTFGTSLVTVLLFALAPAWHAARINLNQALKEGGRSSSAGQGLRSTFVVAEIALTLVLLVGSGLLLRSLQNMQTVELGFNPTRLLTMRISLLEAKYTERQQMVDYYRQLLARLNQLPGVEGAALTSSPPMLRLNNMTTGLEIVGRPTEPGRRPEVRYAVISPEYFRTMQIPLLRGRVFTERDDREAATVAVINENFARRYFPNTDPLGQKVIVGRTTREIVGIVGNIRHETPQEGEDEKLYAPHFQNPWGSVMLLLRTTGEPAPLIAAAQKVVWESDRDTAVSLVATMEQNMAEVIARPRFNALLLGSFAVVALLLAAIGIYGVMSYTVELNTREIGIRLALGAQQADVLRLVVGKGLLLALVGVAGGLLGAFGLTRLLRSLLFGVTPTDALTFVGVAGLLVLVALLACYLPARRAARVDPMIALRQD